MSNNIQPILNNKTYDVLKWIAQILLPAIGALYFGIATIWGLPNSEQVVGTITVIDAFLGAILGLTSISYQKSDAKYHGSIEMEEKSTGAKVFSLQLKDEPESLETMDEVTFKINK